MTRPTRQYFSASCFLVWGETVSSFYSLTDNLVV